ncbi:hypothetical protein GRZ55_11165 [Chelativorans sp. ZYF759]|uniref:hypothetical protein n=1 Tax=Chelativorans sp. ZYF759 TaxID=2692213 RepID=UPI00145C42D4|nr:hypothetical protein [Chelativorans sp. ZYF759]NMG39803.1 hypothetical protein [Chelativorans sp. ZYF759]
MSISAISSDANTILMDVDGRISTVPKSLDNPEYQRWMQLGMRAIRLERNEYNAFPSAIHKKVTSSTTAILLFIFSSGIGHAQSQRQRWVKVYVDFSDPDDVQVIDIQQGVYFENSAGFQTLSFLDDILEPGEVFGGKNIFRARCLSPGVYETKIQSTIAVTTAGGDNGTYAIWAGRPVQDGSDIIITGYRVSPTPFVTAAFVSSNGGWDFTFKEIIGSNPALAFGEAGYVIAGNGDHVCVMREETGANRPLYQTRKTGGVGPFPAPALITPRGTQPELHRLPNDDLALPLGLRQPNRSGLDAAGRLASGTKLTGVGAHRSTDHGVTWPNFAQIGAGWSTDVGQLMLTLVVGSYAMGACYLAPGATNGDYGVEPGIYLVGVNLGRITG